MVAWRIKDAVFYQIEQHLFTSENVAQRFLNMKSIIAIVMLILILIFVTINCSNGEDANRSETDFI